MITNLGKGVVAKYLIGQTPAYASHIAVGCGAKPLLSTEAIVVSASKVSGTVTIETYTDHGFYPGLILDISGTNNNINLLGAEVLSVPTSTTLTYYNPTGALDMPLTSFSSGSAIVNFESADSLKFEMFRIPITSRGYVSENGVTKIVFSGEMPTQERYEITEIGLYSAGSNPSATGFDSRTLFTFSRQEAWKYTTVVGESSSADINLPVLDYPIDDGVSGSMISGLPDVFQTNATNRLFSNPTRKSRSEQLRYLNNMVLVRGDYSSLNISGEIDPASSFISLQTSSNLIKNASTDRLKLAFSVVAQDISESSLPDSVKISLEFVNSNANGSKSATINFETDVDYDWSNRYIVLDVPLSELQKQTGFSWDQVYSVKVRTVVEIAGSPSPNYYVGFDAIRLENLTSENPLYGLTAYTTLVTDDQLPVVKMPNTSSMVEFRLGVGI